MLDIIALQLVLAAAITTVMVVVAARRLSPKVALRIGHRLIPMRIVEAGFARVLHAKGQTMMAFGVNDAAITTNDLIKRFEPTMVPRLESLDAFAPFFHEIPKPAGIEKTLNFVVDSTADEAIRQAPGSHRISRQREAYEVEVHIGDKFRDSRQVTWEKVRKGRLDEPANAVLGVANSMARARNRELGRFLQTQAAQNSGTPTDPTLPATGQTPFWWNTNDTLAPPKYGENTFSAGHDHVETGVTALTLDRIRVYLAHILEHGYGQNGFTGLLQTQEEKTLLGLANVVQQNQTLGVKLRDEFQRVGRASGMNGLMGVQWIVTDWIAAGVVAVVDSNLAGLPQGGAVKVVELAPTSDTEDDKDTQSTWFEGTEQFGAGILHKAAGYTAHVV